MCKMPPKGVNLNLKNYISISCGVTELLTLFGLGFCQHKKTWGAKYPPPNLAISSQMTMKLGKGMLCVGVFTNIQKHFMTSSLC